MSNAGGFGVLGAVGFSPEQLEVELEWIDEHVGDRPYGVDIVIPGKYEGMGEIDADKLEEDLARDDPRRAPRLRRTSCSPITACPKLPDDEHARRELLGWTRATATPQVDVALQARRR